MPAKWYYGILMYWIFTCAAHALHFVPKNSSDLTIQKSPRDKVSLSSQWKHLGTTPSDTFTYHWSLDQGKPEETAWTERIRRWILEWGPGHERFQRDKVENMGFGLALRRKKKRHWERSRKNLTKIQCKSLAFDYRKAMTICSHESTNTNMTWREYSMLFVQKRNTATPWHSHRPDLTTYTYVLSLSLISSIKNKTIM